MMSCLATLLFFSVTGIVSAHRMNIDVTKQTIEIEAYYGDGKPVKNGDIRVYKANDEIYLTGKTDDNGKFSFEVKDIDSEYLIIEVKQTGHKAELKIGTGVSSSGEEMELYQRIFAGIGYLVGMAGIVSFYLSRKMKKNFVEKDKT